MSSFSQYVRSGAIALMPSASKDHSYNSWAMYGLMAQPTLGSSADLAPASIFTRGDT